MPSQPFTITSSVFLFDNFLMRPGVATLPGLGDLPRYPASNLLNADRSEKCRVPFATYTVGPDSSLMGTIGFDCGKDVLPNAAAMVDVKLLDANFKDVMVNWPDDREEPDFRWSVAASSSPDFSTDVLNVDLGRVNIGNSLYEATYPSPNPLSVRAKAASGVSRGYFWRDSLVVGSPPVFIPFNPRRYWKFRIYPIYFTDLVPDLYGVVYLEVGVCWLGWVRQFPVGMNIRIQSESHSTVGTLDSGRKFFDRRRRGRTVTATSANMSNDDSQTIRNLFDVAEGTPMIIDVAPFTLDPTNSEQVYYGYTDGRIGWEQRTINTGRISFAVEEEIA